MGCFGGKEKVKCPSCQTVNELDEQSFENDADQIQRFSMFRQCKSCKCGLVTEQNGILWSKPRPESYEAEMEIVLTDKVLQQFVPSNPYDSPCPGFKLFFKVGDKDYGVWLPRSDLVEGTKLYVAVEKPPPDVKNVGEAVVAGVLTLMLAPEDLIPIPKAVDQMIEQIAMNLPGAERLDKLVKGIENWDGWGFDNEMKHESARVMRWAKA